VFSWASVYLLELTFAEQMVQKLVVRRLHSCLAGALVQHVDRKLAYVLENHMALQHTVGLELHLQETVA
jgi:hypothetical protein